MSKYESMSKQELIELLLLREKPLCNKPCDAFDILKRYGKKKQEYFIVLFIDGAGQIYGKKIVSVGTINNTLVHPREVFAPAIAKRAASIVIAHNHPSNVLLPSAEDINVTQCIVNAGKILGIPVRDHIIFSDTNYYSMCEHSDVYFNI